MKPILRLSLHLALWAVILCMFVPLARAQDSEALLKQGHQAWEEKSYARALELYTKAKAAGGVREPEEVDFRIVTALYKTEKWDEAITAAKALAGRATWKARVNYLLGRLYFEVPHQGYKIGDKLVRGTDYPEVEGAVKPVQVWLQEEDLKASLGFLETAKVQAQQERDLAMRIRSLVPIYPMPSDQEIDLNLDLAGLLPQRSSESFILDLDAGKGGDENIDSKLAYDPTWTYPKKVLYLYNEARALDASENKQDAVLSLWGKALFVNAYRQRLDQWANKYDVEQKKYIVRPYPFDHLEAIVVWAELVEAYPRNPLAPQAQLMIAQFHEGKGDLVKAMAAYAKVVDKFGAAKWASNARAAMWRITSKALSFSMQGSTKPGSQPRLMATARNLDQVEFAVYTVKLEELFTKPERLNDPQTRFTSLTNNLGNVADAMRQLGKPVATFTWKTEDKKDYKGVSKELSVPVTSLGAYLVVASAADKRFSQLHLITDLALLKKADRDSAFVYVADAATGLQVNGANVILKETYNDNSANRVSLAQGKSDDAGFFEKKLTRGPNIYSNNVAAFAWINGRYAVTGMQGGGYYGYGDNRGEARVLSYTERPVYRPGQKVAFRQVLTSRVGGGNWQPLNKTEVTVTVTNPQGESFWTKKLTTGEFGSISGDFNVPAGAPLGEWNISSNINQTARNVAASGGSRFRLEEYKRPEFEVTVTAPQEAKRPGETVAARINARYYFGAPVPNATVKYTVRRTVWWAGYNFPQPFDWLYQYWGAGDYDTGRRNIGGEGAGEIVKEGTVKTDAKGFAELSFQTKALEENSGNSYYRYYANPLYNIEAEVTDASRRTIEAQGSVKVSDQQYFAFLNVQRGYFLQNDRVPVELKTQDANNQPFKAVGKMVVYKLLPGNKEEKVFEEAVTTDEQGRAFWNWEAKLGGQFRIAYEAVDAWNKTIKAETVVWVAGQGLDSSLIRLNGVTILLDKRYYEEGQNLKALLVADKPGTTVLLTQEIGGEILRRDVYTITGKNREITIPIERKHVPNFFLAAAVVRDFEVYQAQQEVFVPPVRQLLNVAVTGDKSVYLPGEKGTFTIKATDYRGAPARGEFSLAVVDASLFYIQKDFTPDLRQFYYADRRGNSVNLDSHRSGNFEARFENDEKTPNMEQFGMEVPDNFGQLNLPPGGGGYYGGPGRGRFAAYEMRAMAVPSAAPMTDARITRLENKVTPPMRMKLEVTALHRTGTGGGAGDKAEGEGDKAEVQVRSNFAETAFWSPAVVTENGEAKVEVTFPDSLTQWHATARGLTRSVEVGSAETDVATKKDLLVRLQAPRFFVERDKVTLSANVHNYGSKTEKISVSLDTGGNLISLLSEGAQPKRNLVRTIELPAGGEQRLDFPAQVNADGEVTIRVAARTATNSDAVQMTYPILVHGVQRFAAQNGTMPGNGKTRISLNFPKERRLGASQLNLQLNPSLAAQMLDALPYLADYPYGCVEQTMSRFLPAVITEKTLRDAGINLATLRQRAKAYEAEAKTAPLGERVTNTGYSYPKGMPNSRNLEQMASRLWHRGRTNNPLWDEAELKKMVNTGLERLYEMQRPDGGWGWWQGSGQSDPYMSAYVVYGLATARAADVSVRGDVLDRGFSYITNRMRLEGNLHLLTYLAYARSMQGAFPADIQQKIVAGRLYEQRERLTAYSKSLLAMALSNAGEKEKAGVLVRNLENTAKVDAGNGTARWTQANQWWYWYNNDEETNAVALRAFVQIDPANKLTPMLMKWLTTKARGSHWQSTKATAEAVYSLAAYVNKFRELDVDYTLNVSLNNQLKRTYRVTRDNALYFDNRFVTGDFFLENGANEVVIEKTGKGNLYWSAYTEYFSLEEPIKASGNEIGINRRYFKLTRKSTETVPEVGAVPAASKPVMGKVAGLVAGRRVFMPQPMTQAPAEPEYIRTELKDGAALKSGDLVEVEVILTSKNDYTYLVFEDMKAAGLEPVDLRSGSAWGDGLSSNVELRDEKVAFFVDNLPQGKRVLRYRLRAEVPGEFHALPTNGYAMYAPEVRAISDEMRVTVTD